MVCILFSEISTGRWAVLQLLCCPSKQGELPENILQNLFHNLTVVATSERIGSLTAIDRYGFVGCLKHLNINGASYDVVQYAHEQDVGKYSYPHT